MIDYLSHSIDVSAGGPGLPLINLSTEGGDLRVTHFISLHGLQLIPLFSFLMIYLKENINLPAPTFFTVFLCLFSFLELLHRIVGEAFDRLLDLLSHFTLSQINHGRIAENR